MSARQAFIPRAPSRVASSEPHQQLTDARPRDGDSDMFANGNGKARSISAFLGQKRGADDTASHGAEFTQGAGLQRTHTNTSRRSLEGIIRPEMTPMSVIPYPAMTQLGGGMKQPGPGQTLRKTAGPGASAFPRQMTPVSVPRGLKKGFGIFADNREDGATFEGSADGNGIVRMGLEGETDTHAGASAGVGGYMHVFEGSGSAGSVGGLQASLSRDVVAPVPGYALGGLGANPMDEGCEVEGIFTRSSRSLSAMVKEDASSEQINSSRRGLGGTKRAMRHEDVEESGRYGDEGHHTQGAAKRMKQVLRDRDEYLPISSPHIPPTPEPPVTSGNIQDPSLVLGSLFESMEDFVSPEEIEADCKRWRECTTEEWLKGADELAQEYTDILNMVKDHLTQKVMAYAGMITSVEERRTEVNRNVATIHGKWDVVRENISKLGMKK